MCFVINSFIITSEIFTLKQKNDGQGILKPIAYYWQVKNCTILIQDDSVFEPEEEFQVHLGSPQGDHWIGAMIGVNDIVTVTITNDEDGE